MTTASERIRPVRIVDEMRSSYLDYAMSVIVARALPDVRDGLKPVQRRILYAMSDLSLGANQPYKKSARIVGEVLGKYHPHGDASVYDALVRMAQDFTMQHPLVDGQGNFGSVDDDPPAAMRYTEARLASIAMEMLADIDLGTVDFADNFDGSLKEPLVLPARMPNLLVNGAAGIAVGMATSIPPHNLGEICDAVVRLIDKPETAIDELMELVPAPDFPTHAIIRGRSGVVNAYSTGQGRVLLQARAEIEELKGGRSHIVVTEIPYQVNKAALVERIAQLVRDKKVQGISDVRDESDRRGMRIVIELRRDVPAQLVLNNLYKHTPMQQSFPINMLALVDGQPRVLGLKQMLEFFIQHRQRVVVRRSEFLLKKAKERAHILEGLRIALEFLDEVIALIRKAPDVDAARNGLMQRFGLSEIQAQAILDMQLRRLAALERQKLEDEYQELRKTIAELEALLADPAKVLGVVKDETLKLKEKYAVPRRTQINDQEIGLLTAEELILHQDVVVTLSQRGYVKRIPYTTYKLQHRGGKGVRGQATREDDAANQILVADTHDLLLFFTTRGRVYSLKCFALPGDASRTARGVSIATLLPVQEGERITTVLAVPTLQMDDHLVLATRKGEVKAMPLRHLANIHSNGLIAMDLESGDDLVAARLVDGYEDVVMVSRNGYGICFPVVQVPQRSRAAGGVHGIRLEPDDAVVAMDLAAKDNSLLVVTQNGYGKLTPLDRFRSQRRYGKGLRAIRVSEKTGPVADAQVVRQREGVELVLVSSRSQVTRTGLAEISVQGRLARGSRVWTGDDGDYLVALACFAENGRPVAQASAAASGPATTNGSAEAAIDTTDDDVLADDQSSEDSEQ